MDLGRDRHVGSGRTPAGIGNGMYDGCAGDGDGLGKNASGDDKAFDLSGIGDSQERGGPWDLSLSDGTTPRADDGISGPSSVFGGVVEEDMLAGDGCLEESHHGRSDLGYARRSDDVGIANNGVDRWDPFGPDGDGGDRDTLGIGARVHGDSCADRWVKDPQGLDGHDARVHGDIRRSDAAAELGDMRDERVERIMRVGIDSEQHGPKIPGEPREVSGRPGSNFPQESREVSGRPGPKFPQEPREVSGRPGSNFPQESRDVSGRPGPKIPGETREVSGRPGPKITGELREVSGRLDGPKKKEQTIANVDEWGNDRSGGDGIGLGSMGGAKGIELGARNAGLSIGWNSIDHSSDVMLAFLEGRRVEQRQGTGNRTKHSAGPEGGAVDVGIVLDRLNGNAPLNGRIGDISQGSSDIARSPKIDAGTRAKKMEYTISTPPPQPPNGISHDAAARGNGISEYEGCEGRVDAIEGVTIDIRNATTEMNDEIRDGLRRIHDRLDEVEEKSITQRAEMIDVERNVQRQLNDSIRDLRSWIREELTKAVEPLGRERGEASESANHVERDEFKEIAKSVDRMSSRVRFVAGELKQMKGTMDVSMSKNIAEPLQQIRESINGMTSDIGTVKGRVDATEKLIEKMGKEYAEIMDENKQLRDRLRVVEYSSRDRGNIARSTDRTDNNCADDGARSTCVRIAGRIDGIEANVAEMAKMLRRVRDQQAKDAKTFVASVRIKELEVMVQEMRESIAKMQNTNAADKGEWREYKTQTQRRIEQLENENARLRTMQETQEGLITELTERIDAATKRNNIEAEMSAMRYRVAEVEKTCEEQRRMRQALQCGDGHGGVDPELRRREYLGIVYQCFDMILPEEPNPANLHTWLGEVARAVKSAYIYDGEYGYSTILRVRDMSESELDRPLKYAALENKLWEGLRNMIKSTSLASKVQGEMFKRTVGRETMSAMRLLSMVVRFYSVSPNREQEVLNEALSCTACEKYSGQCEVDSLDVFMDKWDSVRVRVEATGRGTWSDEQLGDILHSKVRHLSFLNHDIEAWRKRPAEGKTHSWLYDRIKKRIEEWRADQNYQYMEDWAQHLSSRGGPQP